MRKAVITGTVGLIASVAYFLFFPLNVHTYAFSFLFFTLVFIIASFCLFGAVVFWFIAKCRRK